MEMLKVEDILKAYSRGFANLRNQGRCRDSNLPKDYTTDEANRVRLSVCPEPVKWTNDEPVGVSLLALSFNPRLRGDMRNTSA